jgi:hypothetical protein
MHVIVMDLKYVGLQHTDFSIGTDVTSEMHQNSHVNVICSTYHEEIHDYCILFIICKLFLHLLGFCEQQEQTQI